MALSQLIIAAGSWLAGLLLMILVAFYNRLALSPKEQALIQALRNQTHN